MSDRNQDVETKAGHAPAVKVGGMRVTQRSRSPGGTETADPDNPQIPPTNKESGDDQVHGVGGLQSQPKDLLVKGTSGIPATAKDLGMHLEGVRHTHDKGIGMSQHAEKAPFNSTQPSMVRHNVTEPRNHGTNH